ncbi:universal stress protein [Roseovarius rhodophyticola]|uniref:Universal stress protein n=1 Tax=Roseovarius rhodophyticola TaxID=3080827 RepID=A0ABZ2TAD3_9RHOB|nr:universal stress protein [Roseovarius sp. W115]MDV2930351.1 universal stress protein [Roseovarius sp. W115]
MSFKPGIDGKVNCIDLKQRATFLNHLDFAQEGFFMFKHILVPVDLDEKDSVLKAISVASDQAKLYSAQLTLVSVTGGLQAKMSHSSVKYAQLLGEFAAEQAAEHGVKINSHVYGVPDPSVEVDRKLLEAISDFEADLVVMATHQPGWVEYFIDSHGGRLATHAPVSVFVVRDT